MSSTSSSLNSPGEPPMLIRARNGACRCVGYQSSYIKIETLRGKNPTEIHGALSEVCGEFTVDCNTVSRWANYFRSNVRTDHD